MELKYKNALKENNLSISELPEDAKIGISNIDDVLKGIAMLEKRGKKPTEKTFSKLKAMDKWVYYEILDYLNDTEKNDDDIPYESDEVLDELKDENENEPNKDSSQGMKVEEALETMFATGKKEWSIDEIKGSSKILYDIIFDNFDEEEENGIETSRYKLIETDEQVFTLTKK
jgi:hypothetical protein